MKEAFHKIINNGWAYLWFALGLIFIGSAIIRTFQHSNDQTIALLAMGIACHGRAETKILLDRIKALEE